MVPSCGRAGCVMPLSTTWMALVGESLYRRSEEHTSELQSPCNLVCRLLLEKKKKAVSVRRVTRVTAHQDAERLFAAIAGFVDHTVLTVSLYTFSPEELCRSMSAVAVAINYI